VAESILKVGQEGPTFTLKDQDGREVSPASLRGRAVILSFHPLAWTPVCTRQMQDLEKHRAEFERLNAVALGLSVDSVPCKRAWASAIGVKETALLADFWPHGAVARAYGIFREGEGYSERAVLVLDGEGVVRFAKVYPMSQAPDVQEILGALQGL
jgi:peroxiredoxin